MGKGGRGIAEVLQQRRRLLCGARHGSRVRRSRLLLTLDGKSIVMRRAVACQREIHRDGGRRLATPPGTREKCGRDRCHAM
jgi:hypothetical protein